MRRVLFVIVPALFFCISCASTQKQDIESSLISAFAANCKTVEIKVENRDIYIITATMKVSGEGCPIALITGWREGRIIKEKEVEICECRERK